jgi:hypothetical protein
MILRAVACFAAVLLLACGGAPTSVAPTADPPTAVPTANPPTAVPTANPPTAVPSTAVPPTVPTILEEWPERFATHYGLSFEMPFENEPYTEGGLVDAFLVRERVTLVISGRTAGSGVLTAIDYRPCREAVECGGESYVGELAHDLSNSPGGFEGELKDGTRISLDADREVAVYVGDMAPTCFEHHGTYTVSFSGEGPPATKSGRYSWVNGSLDFD